MAIICTFQAWCPELQSIINPISILSNYENLQYFITTKLLNCCQAVIPVLEDTLKEWGFLQVMTQVIGQESYQATLHPLPVGSRIMGGQGKRILSPG
jgi:hypothetical protein